MNTCERSSPADTKASEEGGEEAFLVPELRFPLQPMVRQPWMTLLEQRSTCTPWRSPHQNRWVPEGAMPVWEACTGAGCCQDLWPHGERSPHGRACDPMGDLPPENLFKRCLWARCGSGCQLGMNASRQFSIFLGCSKLQISSAFGFCFKRCLWAAWCLAKLQWTLQLRAGTKNKAFFCGLELTWACLDSRGMTGWVLGLSFSRSKSSSDKKNCLTWRQIKWIFSLLLLIFLAF